MTAPSEDIPMTATVEDNALLLEVLAGPDGLDPRQYGGAVAKPYREALGRGAGGLKIAVVEEGFGHPQSLPQVDSLVREAAERFKGMGAAVETVSIPMHSLGSAIWLAVAAEGALMQMMLGNGFGFNWQGLYVTSMLDFHSSWRNRADELCERVRRAAWTNDNRAILNFDGSANGSTPGAITQMNTTSRQIQFALKFTW